LRRKEGMTSVDRKDDGAFVFMLRRPDQKTKRGGKKKNLPLWKERREDAGIYGGKKRYGKKEIQLKKS